MKDTEMELDILRAELATSRRMAKQLAAELQVSVAACRRERAIASSSLDAVSYWTTKHGEAVAEIAQLKWKHAANLKAGGVELDPPAPFDRHKAIRLTLIGDDVAARARVAMREKRGDVPRATIARRLGEGLQWALNIEHGHRRMTLAVFIDWCIAIEADPVEVLRDAIGGGA
jgi:hypothetical protein